MPTSSTHSLFYQATKAMFILALGIAVLVVLLSAVGRLFGWKWKSDVPVYGTRSVVYAMVASALEGNTPVVPIGPHLYGYQEGSDVVVTQHGPTAFPFSLFCGAEKMKGGSIFDGLLYRGIVYNVFRAYLDDGTFGDFTGSSLDLATGEFRSGLLPTDIPEELKALSVDQVYGTDPLPDEIVRVDSAWLAEKGAPQALLQTSDGCKAVVAANGGVLVIFGGLFLLAIAFERRRSV